VILARWTVLLLLLAPAAALADPAPADAPALLRWDILRQTLYNPPDDVRIADSVSVFNGKPVRLEGYLMPRFGDQDPSDLLLTALHPWSLFCGPTDMTAVVEVSYDGFDPQGPWPHLPVEITGVFSVSRHPGDFAAIYRLRALSWRRLHTWEQDFPGVVEEVEGEAEQ
jgi:hypothetical protein